MPNNHFVQYLVELADRDDRGALAHLRRGLGKPPGTAPEMFPLVVPWIPNQAPPGVQDAYFLVASLFGAHPSHGDALGGMGDTFHRQSDEQTRAGMERRFVALLNARREDLPDHLRHAVSLARSKGVAINYDHLLEDLIRWSRPNRQVQRRWAYEFWGAHGAPAEETAIASSQSPTPEMEES